MVFIQFGSILFSFYSALIRKNSVCRILVLMQENIIINSSLFNVHGNITVSDTKNVDRHSKMITTKIDTCTCTCTCDVMDFSRLSLYCPYQWSSSRHLGGSWMSWPKLHRHFEEDCSKLWWPFGWRNSSWGRRDPLKDNLRVWPRRSCTLSERWKKWCVSIFSFPVKIL